MAQDRLADLLENPAIQLSRPADRAQVVARIGVIESNRRQNARAKAVRLGLPIRREFANGRVEEIIDFDGDQPLYFTTDNSNAAVSTGANLLRPSPYSLSGAGVTIGVWDGGAGRASHQEFGGRLIVMDGAAGIDHATHVGGTLIASGIVASARGMADSATVNSYDWTSDTTEMTARGAASAGEANKIYLSNHSYGFISGWNYVNNGTRVWEWNGLGTNSAAIEDDFGRYHAYARDADSLAFNAPYYLIFRSSGNDGGDNPSAGETVSLSPGGGSVVNYDPSVHPPGDGNYRAGFETIGFNAVGKNVITVGSAADAVTNGVRDPSKAILSYFSATGPTDDGRIKPDVVANGEGLYSSLNANNTSYGVYSGTSMATPNTTGSAALLIQQFGSLFPGQAMRASTLKGLLIHTADDRGNVGPDYKYGWGMVNVKTAADLIRDQYDFPTKQRLTENQLTTATVSRTQSFVWDGVSPIWATLCWADPAALAITVSDSRSSRLVNNLNLKIIAPNGSEYLPFVMPFVGNWTQASMNSQAITGINNTDNVEQVRIAAPPATGTYQVVVSFSGTLTNSSQNYSLLLSGSSAAAPPPPPPAPLALAAVSPNKGISGTTFFDLTGTGLRSDTAVKLTRTGQSDIIASAVQLIGSSLRCQVNLTGAAAGAWDVVATNPNSETSTLPAAFTVTSAIWSENFDGTVIGWTSQTSSGSPNSWALVTNQYQTFGNSYFALGPASKSITNLTTPAIPIPALATNLQLKFSHNWNLQNKKDGGKLELSVDNGGSWFDVESTGSGATFVSNGYNSTISPITGNGPPTGAWSGNSNGFVETVVSLTDTAKFAGKTFRARWRIATDNSTASSGWYIDSIALLGGSTPVNQAPIITTAATTSSGESVTDPDSSLHQIIRGTSTTLSVLASDDGGEALLTYSWSVLSGPTYPVLFTENGSNSGKTTTVSFEGIGDYQIAVSVHDAYGLAASSIVNVRVVQSASGIVVSPALASVSAGGTRAFGATLLDQFGGAMVVQPPSFGWACSGGGTVNSSGLFTATTVGGPFVITASSGGFSNTASVSVAPAAATVVIGNLNQTYTGAARTVSVTTNPPALSSAVTYNESLNPPVNAGSYAVEVNITDPNYQGSASGLLVVGKATATMTVGQLSQTYDGTPKTVTAQTMPAGLFVVITYDGSTTAPTSSGTYAVAATVVDSNYQGTALDTLVIKPAEGYAAWCAIRFTEAERTAGLADDRADPDGDGWLNLAEYAVGGDPRNFTPALHATRDSMGLSLIFTRPANLPDVTYRAESSENLHDWTPVTLEVITPGTTETVRATDPLTTGNTSLRYLRLRFIRQ